VVFDKTFNLNVAADAAMTPFTADTFRVKTFVWDHDHANQLHAQSWLLKTYAIPAGKYVSQIWATPYLRQDKSNLGYPLPETRQMDGQSYPEVFAGSAEENSGDQRHNSLNVYHMMHACENVVWSLCNSIGPKKQWAFTTL